MGFNDINDAQSMAMGQMCMCGFYCCIFNGSLACFIGFLVNVSAYKDDYDVVLNGLSSTEDNKYMKCFDVNVNVALGAANEAAAVEAKKHVDNAASA